MTIPYDATDKSCSQCGEDVEDYTGHLNASEITVCEECHDPDEYYPAEVVQVSPRV